MKPRRQPNYAPCVCHSCSASGCDRCGEVGFTVGPDHRPADPAELNGPQSNYADLQRGRAA